MRPKPSIAQSVTERSRLRPLRYGLIVPIMSEAREDRPLTPEDQRALLAARAQAAALGEERRRLAAERRKSLGMAPETSRAAERRISWPLVLSTAFALLVAALLLIGHR